MKDISENDGERKYDANSERNGKIPCRTRKNFVKGNTHNPMGKVERIGNLAEPQHTTINVDFVRGG
jgi:hypothetical protein